MTKIDHIHWHGHDAFRITGSKTTVWIDPYDITPGVPKGDVVLVTHQHHDHCSPPDLGKVCHDKTLVIAPADCQAQIPGNKRSVKPGERIDLGDGIVIETIPAYNVNKKFHPRSNQWVGYVLTIDGQRIYHAGDTDAIDEMKKLDVDVALLPVSGTYVMTAEEAVGAAKSMKVKVVIPMHYGSVVGTDADAKRFAALVQPPLTAVVKQRE